jgi:tetratricopeptide (TPR) repeat protein
MQFYPFPCYHEMLFLAERPNRRAARYCDTIRLAALWPLRRGIMRSHRNLILAGLLFSICVAEPQRIYAARTSNAPEFQETRETLFEWSPLIQQIQEHLIEFDLFTGPANGKLNAETRSAIRIYQRQSDLPVNATPNEGLLEHMERVGRAEALKRRLAKARDEQVEMARKALSANPATRDLVATGPRDPISAANANPAGCLRDPTVDCLIESALSAINSITRDDYRDWALRDVVQALARAGRTDEARANIKRLTDLRLVLVSLRETAIALAKAGKVVEASALAATIPNNWNRARAFLAVVKSDAGGSSSLDALLALLPQIEDRTSAVEIAAELAVYLSGRGANDRATKTIATLEALLNDSTPSDQRRMTLSAIAAAYARIGQSDQALRALERIGDTGRDHFALAETAGQLARSRDSVAAVAMAERLRTPHLFVLAMTKIAMAQARLGNHDAARANLKRAKTASLDIERPYAIDTALARIAIVWAKIPDYPQAFGSIGEIKSNLLKARTLWRLAMRMAKSQNDAEENNSTARAEAATERIESPFDRAAMLARAAIEFAEAKQIKQARNLFYMAVREARSIKNDWWRARIFSLLATVLGEL